MTRKEIDAYTEFVKIYGAMGLAWIKIKGKRVAVAHRQVPVRRRTRRHP